jgi:ABC-type Zn uptake system ZnuABC Zn-binding protein ZnuA
VAQQMVSDMGIELVTLYTESLSEPGSPAGSYLAYMRYNVSAIVNALQ